MSWSDDIRCLHCDGRLPLYRKITHGQFCSSAHRKAYWQEQERLAVERLSQTHNSLLAYRTPAPIGPSAPGSLAMGHLAVGNFPGNFQGPAARSLQPRALEPEDWRESPAVPESAGLAGADPVPAVPAGASASEITRPAAGPRVFPIDPFVDPFMNPVLIDPAGAGFVFGYRGGRAVLDRGTALVLAICDRIEYPLEPLLDALFAAGEANTPPAGAGWLAVAGVLRLQISQVRSAPHQSPQLGITPSPVEPRASVVRPEWSWTPSTGLAAAAAVELPLAWPADSEDARFGSPAVRRAAKNVAEPLPLGTGLTMDGRFTDVRFMDVRFDIQSGTAHEAAQAERTPEWYAPVQERLFGLAPGAPRDLLQTGPAGSLAEALIASPEVRLPLHAGPSAGLSNERSLEWSAPLEERLFALAAGAPRDFPQGSPVGSLSEALIATPQVRFPLHAGPSAGLSNQRTLEWSAPLEERLFGLAPGTPRNFQQSGPVGSLAETLIAAPQVRAPLDVFSSDRLSNHAFSDVAPVSPAVAGLTELPLRNVPQVPGTDTDSWRAVDFGRPAFNPAFFSRTGRPVSATLGTAPPAAQVRLARGNPYRIEAADCVGSAGARTDTNGAGLQISPPDIALSGTGRRGGVAAAQETVWSLPRAAAMLRLPMSAASSARPPINIPHASATAAMYSLPVASRIAPRLPQSGLEPLDAKPVSDVFQAEFPPPPMGSGADKGDPAAAWTKGAFVPVASPFAKSRPKGIPAWQPVADFWKQAPRDLRMLTILIPALIALWFHPGLPKFSLQAPKSTGLGSALDAQFANVRQTVVDRAAVALDEDFRSGLDGWIGRGNAAAAWSFDATGFVQPGPLALYQPSMGLSDYQLQFLGMIDKKALSWVVRAADFENYYVIKLVVLKPGPLPTIGLTRYAVIDGKAMDRADTIVPINARPDMLYRVRLDAHDDDFSLEVQGQMIDSWSERRLRRGGIGFFSARDEESRVRWVQVTHQYDMLGRLCAYLAPYNIPTGSW
jgi:hypothetical protein